MFLGGGFSVLYIRSFPLQRQFSFTLPFSPFYPYGHLNVWKQTALKGGCESMVPVLFSPARHLSLYIFGHDTSIPFCRPHVGVHFPSLCSWFKRNGVVIKGPRSTQAQRLHVQPWNSSIQRSGQEKRRNWNLRVFLDGKMLAPTSLSSYHYFHWHGVNACGKKPMHVWLGV